MMMQQRAPNHTEAMQAMDAALEAQTEVSEGLGVAASGRTQQDRHAGVGRAAGASAVMTEGLRKGKRALEKATLGEAAAVDREQKAAAVATAYQMKRKNEKLSKGIKHATRKDEAWARLDQKGKKPDMSGMLVFKVNKQNTGMTRTTTEQVARARTEEDGSGDEEVYEDRVISATRERKVEAFDEADRALLKGIIAGTEPDENGLIEVRKLATKEQFDAVKEYNHKVWKSTYKPVFDADKRAIERLHAEDLTITGKSGRHPDTRESRHMKRLYMKSIKLQLGVPEAAPDEEPPPAAGFAAFTPIPLPPTPIYQMVAETDDDFW